MRVTRAASGSLDFETDGHEDRITVVLEDGREELFYEYRGDLFRNYLATTTSLERHIPGTRP